MWGVWRFGNKGKLSPRYVRSFQVLKRVSPLAYKVELPPNLAGVHDVFHVSQLRKCVHDPSHVINYEPLDIQANLTYEEWKINRLLINVCVCVCVWSICITKYLNTKLKEDRYFVNEVKTQLREKPLSDSQTQEIHYSEDKASYNTVVLTYP